MKKSQAVAKAFYGIVLCTLSVVGCSQSTGVPSKNDSGTTSPPVTTGGATGGNATSSSSTGGSVATGGASGTGGSGTMPSGAGGASQTGGAPETGGRSATGGVTSSSGGNSSTGGGIVSDAGRTGGTTAIATGTGGSGINAGGSGGPSTGGASMGGSTGTSTAGALGTGGLPAGGASGAVGGSDVPATFFMRYEAESPSNTLTYPVEIVTTDGATACPTDGVKEGANCASGGKVVAQILGRSPCTPPTSTTSYTNCQNKGGGVQFNAVTVPAAGNYDVTWWYHCGPDTPGHADVYGDTKCGGLNYNTGAGTGCRPHLIDVNGVPMSSTIAGQTALYYQFPCYTAPWSTLHGATTSLPLKAGANTILIHAPGATTLDAADIDAIDVQPNGKGVAPAPLWPKLVTPVVSGS